MDISKPLCIDLDGTLVKTDTLLESVLVLLKTNPFIIFFFAKWLFHGKAYFKKQVARRTSLPVSSLPFHPELMSFLKEEHRKGRRLVLATAADEEIAQKVATHVGLFNDVLASDGKTNFSGTEKLRALQEKFGARGFVYAGNANADLPIWKESHQAILVNTSRSLENKVKQKNIPFSNSLNPSPNILRSLIKVIRPHQWVKNLLLFVPIVTAHKLDDPHSLWQAFLAFCAFSFCASSVYVLNDLLDLEADRHHPQKKFRPFAAGDLPLSVGFGAIPLFLIAGAGIAYGITSAFMIILAAYLLLTLAYSLHLKQVVLVDVVLLAGLYTIRILAGAAAIGVVTSPWLLGFSTFLFLSLALSKRYSELYQLRRQKKEKTKGRGYLASDLEQLASMGSASGYISVLVLALYLNSQEVTGLYANPLWLWLTCPLLIYWISRVWLLAHRGQLHEDPVVFALKDRVSYLTGGLITLIMLMAM